MPAPRAQSIDIDLPLKVLALNDASAQLCRGYKHTEWLAERHDVPSCRVAADLRKTLAGLTKAAAAKQRSPDYA